MDVVNATTPPTVVAALPARYRRLAHVCFVIQGITGDEPFYLDARRAGDLIGVGAMTAWRRLMILCHPAMGILELVEKGNERRSNRYRLVAGRESARPGGRNACA
jgi:hypothetical protein